MSLTQEREPSVLPQLRFRLIGVWWEVDLDDEAAGRSAIDRILDTAIGRRDDAAQLRGLARRDLRRAADEARASQAVTLALCTELDPGTAMPIILTVHAPKTLRMAPSIGTGAEAVLDVVGRLVAELTPDSMDEVVRRTAAGIEAVRTHRILTERQEVDGAEVATRRLIAEYWVPVPGTKLVTVVSLMTPLGDIPNIMLDFFDAIVGAATFGAATQGSR